MIYQTTCSVCSAYIMWCCFAVDELIILKLSYLSVVCHNSAEWLLDLCRADYVCTLYSILKVF